MLEQLEEMEYFSTLVLASEYWQVHMSRISREKTAFMTQQGLFEFCVMPLTFQTCTPAVFQLLMQQVIGVLNPLEGQNFGSVYVLVYSKILEVHLQHLSIIMNRLREVNSCQLSIISLDSLLSFQGTLLPHKY